MPAGVGVDEVYCRFAAKGGDSVTAEVAGVVSVEIAEPLRVDDVDGGIRIDGGVVNEIGCEVKSPIVKGCQAVKSWKSSAYLSSPVNTCVASIRLRASLPM